jgi:hypothetical protein
LNKTAKIGLCKPLFLGPFGNGEKRVFFSSPFSCKKWFPMVSPTIAIIGASTKRHKFGNKAVRAYVSKHWVVFPVHPREKTIEGLKVYPTLKDVPADRLDRISLYLPPKVIFKILPDLLSKECGEIWFNPGTTSPELMEKVRGLGLQAVLGCSIVDIGASPSEFGE